MNIVLQRRIRTTIWVLALKVNPDVLGYGLHFSKTYPFMSFSLSFLPINITLVITDTSATPVAPYPKFWFFATSSLLAILFHLIPLFAIIIFR